MFCHHQNEDEVYGSDPVPCPLCGMGSAERSRPAEETQAEDSNEALRHALFDTGSSETTERVHW